VGDCKFKIVVNGIAQEQSRLEEMCNIARINLAIIDIVDAGEEKIE
jgi:hypothetical protein